MNKRKQAKTLKCRPAEKAARRRWPVYIVLPVFGSLLVSGFFLAGQQHFASMDYGMKNSRLKKQIEALEAEKRRLLLAREVSLSPVEIKRAAKKTGLLDAAEIRAEVARAEVPDNDRAVASQPVPVDSPLVVKTASVEPVSAAKPASATFARSGKPEGTVKKTAAAE
jgi:hypothetical protein